MLHPMVHLYVTTGHKQKCMAWLEIQNSNNWCYNLIQPSFLEGCVRKVGAFRNRKTKWSLCTCAVWCGYCSFIVLFSWIHTNLLYILWTQLRCNSMFTISMFHFAFKQYWQVKYAGIYTSNVHRDNNYIHQISTYSPITMESNIVDLLT